MFSYEKLDDLNKQHILLMSKEDYKNKCFKFLSDNLKKKILETSFNFDKVINLVIRERISKFSEVSEMEKNEEFEYYFNLPIFSIEKILWKEETKEKTKQYLEKIIEILKQITEFSAEKIKAEIWDYASEQGRGSVLWPMRYALSGRDKSPDPFILAEILGKEESIKRINKIIKKF